jgi:hypothetical protein
MRMVFTAVALLSIASTVPIAAQDESTRSLKDAIGDGLFGGSWIYEDIEAGYAAARKLGRPLLVSFR